MTGEKSGGDTKAVQEAADEWETEFDELLGKNIRKIKSYDIAFWIEF